MSEPREYTAEEVQEKFLKHVWTLVDYWATLDLPKSRRERLEGLAFSILSTLDGSSMELPGFMVVPVPHEDDKEYHIVQRENYYRPYVEGDTDLCDIGSGSLHELFYQFDPEGD